MVYDETLANRVRKAIGKNRQVTEKHMFGGLSFLFNKKMFCGILKDDLVLRMSHEQTEGALKNPDVRPMDFTGHPMKGFVYLNKNGCKSDKSLKQWIQLSMDYVLTLQAKKVKI